ncbi:M23 family metallopeptidase [Xanthomarina sp. F1114]|uniref:M23 family metallopeptidase n=1 Tax=Xanthomarina sp. F1114 TaxID=2996019 RepID=UPI00225DEA14|nr:M23 family metallopeptidase [Xanthomarina sp. F1114]MCX7548436.1 M23 family metallopeptidase [Xanthomarina sp. F1114]
MNKRLLVFLLLFVTITSFSQEKDKYKKVVAQFEAYYNDVNFDAIYYMYNYKVKRTSSLGKTRTFFNNLHRELGPIDKIEFRKQIDQSELYKITFGSELRDLEIQLDQYNRFSSFELTYHKPDGLTVLERNITKMTLPFNEEWFVLWGGVSKKENSHHTNEKHKYAYDFVIMKEGVTHTQDGKINEDYYAFGKDILAPCDATVVEVITGIEDNIPGELNTEQVTGNTIILETANQEYIVLAHLKHQSIVVREGLFVREGTLLAQSGNSGKSSEPHLHLSLQNTGNMNIATGGKLFFNRIYVNEELKQDYLPIKGDLVKNRS